MRKKGISLIVLVITIIVIVILGTAVMVTFVKNNPISNAKKAVELWGEKMTKEEMLLKEVNGVIDAGKNRWDGTVATSYASGKGTEKEPYIIETPAQLAYLASEVNSGNSYANTFFRITKSMDLENKKWTPIGNGETDYSTVYNVAVTNKFSGHIDGTGITIDNLNIEELDKYGVGLIGVMDSGSVKNIIVRGSVKGKGIVGGIVGAVNAGTVSSCINRASVSAIQDEEANTHSGEIAGGIVGSAKTESLIRENINYGKVETTNYKFETIHTTTGNYSGGIVGRIINSAIENCDNRGNILGVANGTGGIAAITSGTSLVNCRNYGSIEALVEENKSGYTRVVYNVGGIVGLNSRKTTIDNCENLGKITSNGYCIGGIVGKNDSNSTVSNSKNMGKITGKYTDGLNYSGSWIGGIAGQNSASTITNCINLAEIYSEGELVGGIVGNNANASIYNSINRGNVSGNKGEIGGIAGWNVSSKAKISGCSNFGNVTATTTLAEMTRIGGITGSNLNGANIDSCYNLGNITSNATGDKNSVGGIVGMQKVSDTNITGVRNSYNKGTLRSSGVIGGVVGTNIYKADTMPVIENCYYYTTDSEKGIGSNSDSESIIVPIEDPVGVTKKITNEFMNLNEFLSWLNK